MESGGKVERGGEMESRSGEVYAAKFIYLEGALHSPGRRAPSHLEHVAPLSATPSCSERAAGFA